MQVNPDRDHDQITLKPHMLKRIQSVLCGGLQQNRNPLHMKNNRGITSVGYLHVFRGVCFVFVQIYRTKQQNTVTHIRKGYNVMRVNKKKESATFMALWFVWRFFFFNSPKSRESFINVAETLPFWSRLRY